MKMTTASEPYVLDISGVAFIDGISNFNFDRLFEVTAAVVPDGPLAGAIDRIILHPHVLSMYLLHRLAYEASILVVRQVVSAVVLDQDVGTLLGIPIVVNSELAVTGRDGVYETRVVPRDGRVGILRTRES